MEMKTDIRSISLKDIEIFCRNNNMSSFRSKQINEWIWKKRAVSFNEMTSLSQKSRIILDKHFIIKPVKINTLQKSIDGTVKYSFILYDNLMVEGVLIPSKNRITACISSQVGCSLTCAFCATGKLKMKRNLDYPEIYDQVYMLNEEAIKIFDKPISNIVYMGMGEPLLNYSNLINSIHFITSNEGTAISFGAGYHLATKKLPCIFMQNSGLGNSINPLTSLSALFRQPAYLFLSDFIESDMHDFTIAKTIM